MEENTVGLDERLRRIENLLACGKPILRFNEAMEYIGVCKGYLYKLTSQKLIPHYKKGKQLYFKKAELDEWLTSDRVKTVEEVEADADTYIAKKGGAR